MKRYLRLVATFACLGAALVALGVCNRNDQRLEQSHYCQMVKSGAWPDFHHSYQQECKP